MYIVIKVEEMELSLIGTFANYEKAKEAMIADYHQQIAETGYDWHDEDEELFGMVENAAWSFTDSSVNTAWKIFKVE